MNIKELRIGDTVAEILPTGKVFPDMRVAALFEDGTVYLDFDGNEGDVWEANAKDLIKR